MFRDIDAECYIITDGDDTYPAESAREMADQVLERRVDMVVGDRLSSTYFTENKRPFHNFGNSLVRKSINTLFKNDMVPELNPQHIDIIPAQRKRLGTKRGFIAVKSNCSLQSYVPAIFPLHQKYGIKRVLVCTYQAISGAGKTFERWPEMIDNVIPYIGGEEEKSEKEPLKLMGHIEGDQIVSADAPAFTAQCIRVPVTNGHLGAVFMDFEGEKPSEEEIIEVWKNYAGRAQELKLPSAPKQFLHYFTEPDRPQIHSERELEHGMAVSIGRLRPDTQYDYKFVCLSHNTLRGAAGGGVLLAELLAAEGYMD